MVCWSPVLVLTSNEDTINLHILGSNGTLLASNEGKVISN